MSFGQAQDLPLRLIESCRGNPRGCPSLVFILFTKIRVNSRMF